MAKHNPTPCVPITLAEKIEIMQAALNGKPIQARARAKHVEYAWFDIKTENARWNWFASDYRVKP